MIEEIRYAIETPPKSGAFIEVAPGVKWLRMPLPLALDHINLYLIDSGDGWLVIDTGMQLGDTKTYWEEIFAGDALEGKPIKGVLVTHMHPDHVGLAGWLCEKWRVPLYMSRGEYFFSRALSAPSTGMSWTSREYYKRIGQGEEFISLMEKQMGGFSSIVSKIPGSYHRLIDGQVMHLGKDDWKVVIGRGHSSEHVCLYCEKRKLLISGDQVIARITSNVSVMAIEPEANPMQEWLDSHDKFLSLCEDALVLPAHNLPFYGLHVRLKELIAHHEDHLMAIEEACVEAKTATQLLPVLFKRDIDMQQMAMALGECVAHLNYLLAYKRIERTLDDGGVYRYLTIDPAVSKRKKRKHGFIDDEPIMV